MHGENMAFITRIGTWNKSSNCYDCREIDIRKGAKSCHNYTFDYCYIPILQFIANQQCNLKCSAM